MPKAGAFDKAKVKKSGGFGSSKSGRFDAPKESCDYTPSAGAYNTHDIGSMGSASKKSLNKFKSSSFGSTAKRDSAIHGQRNDAPGPGQYADGIKAGFDKKPRKSLSRASSWGSTAQHELGAFTTNHTPAPGEYATPTGITVSSKHKGRSNGFGGGRRFEEPQELVQTDYEVPGAFESATGSASASKMRNTGFGGRQPRAAPINGQKSDAPGPGAYAYARPGAFHAKGTAPSSAFASRSHQHASNPSAENVAVGPSVGAYDMRAYDPHAKKAFRADAMLGKAVPGGFGSSAVRAPKEAATDTPGPGEYHAASKRDIGGDKRPSSVFASASHQRGAGPRPAHTSDGVFVPDGIGDVRASGNKTGFGGATRGLAADEAAEVAQLREMLGKA